MFQALIDSGGQMVQELRSLPWGAHLLMFLALATGLILWCAGRKVLKPMVVVAFALMGGVAGFFLPPITALGDSLSVYAGLAIGLVLGALLGVLLYRFAMATSFGVVLAIAAPLTAAIVLGVPADPAPPPDGGSATASEQIARNIEHLRQSIAEPSPHDTTPDGAGEPNATERQRVAAAVHTATDRVRAFLQALDDELKARWEQLPPANRLIIGGSAAVGLALGFVLGLLLPRWAAGTVTAMFGAAVWLPCALWFWTAAGLPGGPALDRRPDLCLIIWAATSGVGMLMQWWGLVRRNRGKKKPASS